MTGDVFTFADLLHSCGGFSADGCRDLVQIYRSRRDKTTISAANRTYTNQIEAEYNDLTESSRTRISLDPRQPVDLSQLKLADGDSVYVPFATGMITVTGAVASPGLVHYNDGQSVDYYLKAAGGLGFDADKSRMVVYNPATGGEISAASAGRLFDGEVLIVPRKESSDKP
jgi:protein involved in polysaccharide export with SLBB domain